MLTVLELHRTQILLVSAGLGTGDVQISTINIDNDGTHFTVNHQNHGMYFADNMLKFLSPSRR